MASPVSVVTIRARERTVSATSGLLSQAELERLVSAGDIDTVIVGFCDMQGRLTGKRVSARLFVDR